MNLETNRLVQDARQLENLCQQLQGSPWITVDTEFLREKTYYPKLCLIQVATPDLAACVDPLALDSLDPLLDLLYDPSILKIFHAASQDLEIFYHLRAAVPTPLFDTQVAAPLLGHPEQMGYAALVQAYLNITLDKSHSRTDWSKRPLSSRQLSYAADDVIHLASIYPKMVAELEKLGRLAWLEDDFQQLANPDRYLLPLDQAWTKVKAARRMKGKKLAILKRLAGWREEIARKQDRPKGWILKDDVIADLAGQRPQTMADLEHIRGLPVGTRERHGQALLAMVKDPGEPSTGREEDRYQPLHLSPQQDAMVDLAMAVLRIQCAAENINPATIANRKDLEKLISGQRDLNLLKGWRKALAGEQLLALLDGQLQLSIADNQPALRHSAG